MLAPHAAYTHCPCTHAPYVAVGNSCSPCSPAGLGVCACACTHGGGLAVVDRRATACRRPPIQPPAAFGLMAYGSHVAEAGLRAHTHTGRQQALSSRLHAVSYLHCTLCMPMGPRKIRSKRVKKYRKIYTKYKHKQTDMNFM
jgi:hypothetical protein